jgi:hypothetical protein
MPDRIISISISESGQGPAATFGFHLRLDDDVFASNQALTVTQSQTLRELSRHYGQMFEQHRLPQMTSTELAAIGGQLFEFWLAPFWPRLSPRLGLSDQRVLAISSDQASVLNLPWELLRPDGREAIGADAKWSLRRLPWADRQLTVTADALPAGPLRVLYMGFLPAKVPNTT